jgi:putative tricarboxylic transport membrane protein
MIKKIEKYVPSILLMGLAAIFYINLSSQQPNDSIGLLFPKVITSVMFLASLALLIKTFIKQNRKPKEEVATEKSGHIGIHWPLLIVLGIYIGLINVLGFFLSTIFFLFAASRIFNIKPLTSWIFATSFTLVIYILFIKILFVPFPEGVWIFRTINEFIMY